MLRLSALLVIAFSATQSFANLRPIHIGRELFLSYEVPFLAHTSPEPFGSYLSMNLSYPPIKQVYENLKLQTDKPLQTRNDAHITVLTPPEYARISHALSITEVNRIADEQKLQLAPFQVVCVGHATALVDGDPREAYFLVVRSAALLQIRHKIFRAFKTKGGNPRDFNPDLFFPHITVGFIGSDVHYENGVIKDASSCVGTVY